MEKVTKIFILLHSIHKCNYALERERGGGGAKLLEVAD